MIFPLIAVALGVGAILTVVLVPSDSGEPTPPIPLPDNMPQTPVIPSAPPSAPPEVVQHTVVLDNQEVEALARIIASEAGSGTLGEQRAIAWTARNHFRAKNKSIYGTEFPWRSQNGANPPFSSARDANETTRGLAREVLSAPQMMDPTGGATSFFEPKMQDLFYKAGVLARAGETGDRTIDGQKLTDITRFKNYKKDAAQIRAKWGNGSAIFATAGRFEFWGSSKLFAQRGGTVKTIVGGDDVVLGAYSDIPDPLSLLPKYRRRG